MVTSRLVLSKIKEIIEKRYSQLTISMLGKGVFTPRELEQIRELGVDTTNDKSLLELAYYHNFINHPVDDQSPKTVEEMESQQSTQGLKPQGEAPQYTTSNLDDKTKQLIDKLKEEMTTRIQGIVRDNNDTYKMDALKNLEREAFIDEMVKESTLGKVKQQLRDTTKDANRDWQRVVLTEMSNAIGIASVDRIVNDNIDANLEDIYVFRITVKDAKTCKYCRRFYNDSDGSPRLYKLSTLLGNGSNYGKKPGEWMAVAGATHPNERCSQTIELKPGFKLNHDGSVTYMGLEGWKKYIETKLAA